MRKPLEFASFPPALAALASYGPYRAVIAHVIDGDSYYVHIDMGLNTYVFERVRLKDVNTPELREVGGPEARDYVRALMPIGTPCVVRTYKDAQSFGRYVADVRIELEGADGAPLNLADHLVAMGHAVRVR